MPTDVGEALDEALDEALAGAVAELRASLDAVFAAPAAVLELARAELQRDLALGNARVYLLTQALEESRKREAAPDAD